jgi:hypothetical protein
LLLPPYEDTCAFVNLSRTHIRTSVETPSPFWSATALSSEIVESSSRRVTTRSFRKTNSPGEGRKSFTLVAFSRSTSAGSSVYTIFFFITPLSFPPKSRAENPDLSIPAGEPHGHDFAADLTKAKIPLFVLAVTSIFKDDALIVQECLLCILERYAVFGDIVQVPAMIPFEVRRFHVANVLQTASFVNGFSP